MPQSNLFKNGLGALLLPVILLGTPMNTPWAGEGKGDPILFSPNGDGIIDSAIFRLTVSDPGNIAEWVFTINNNSGRRIKRFSGQGVPPATLSWNGQDEHNQLISDGTYQYSMSVLTLAGNKVEIPPNVLICDRQPPTVAASVEPSIFSPEEGSSKPVAQFFLETYDANNINSWLLKFQNVGTGATVRSFFGKGQPPEKVEWDGRTDANDPAPDGQYTFIFVVRDRAGNTQSTKPKTVRIDRKEPLTSVEADPQIFSPNGDKIRDVLTFNITPPANKHIETWTLNITDKKGRAVKTFEGNGQPPLEIRWDGKANSGRTAADAAYNYNFLTKDEAGNRGATLPKTLVLDTTPPEATISLEPTLLSPNGDGYGDGGTFNITVKEANGIRIYKVNIKDDVGNAKKAFEGEGEPPLSLQWAGQDKGGKLLADGQYAYEITVEDNAGNTAAVGPYPLHIDVSPPVVDFSVEPRLISQHGDQKEARFQISVQDASEVEDWSLEIVNSKKKAVRKFSGKGLIFEPLAWSGYGEGKELVPDGTYRCIFWVQDKTKNATTTPPLEITVGSQIPDVSVKASLPGFSPNADGIKDFVTFFPTSKAFNPIRQWTLELTDATGAQIRTFLGDGDPPGEVVWGGEREDKSPSPDGAYKFVLKVVDEAGNRNETAPQTVRVDTTRPEISARAVPDLFSPNGDGHLDETVFHLSSEDQSPIQEWSLSIKNEGNKTVRILKGKGAPPENLEWNGKSSSKKTVPDGPYTYRFLVEDAVGNRTETLDLILKVDSTPPQISVSAEPTLFSPQAESGQNFTMLSLSVKDASDLAHWTLNFINEKGKTVHQVKGEDKVPQQMTWNGRNEQNDPFPNNAYSIQLVVKDGVGNVGQSAPAKVRIDTSKPVLAVDTQEELVPSLVPDVQPLESERGIVLNLAAEVLFETGQAEIRSAAYPTLSEAASMIKKYPTRHVLIEGHTDNVPINTPSFPDNKVLSEARAKAVADYFVRSKKIKSSRFTAVGYGESRPIADNNTDLSRQKNRRVEIIIQKEQ